VSSGVQRLSGQAIILAPSQSVSPPRMTGATPAELRLLPTRHRCNSGIAPLCI